MKLGILGGGQLGRMLLQAAANYDIETWILENDNSCPSAHLCHQFVQGDIHDFDAVLTFGRMVDIITIEIEDVNVDALEILEKEGKKIIPTPATIKTIKDKGRQKQFYAQHAVPTAPYILVENKEQIMASEIDFPIAQKLRTGGYDGKGVQLLRSEEDFEKAFDAPSVLEKLIDIKTELAVIVAVGIDGTTVSYSPVEMVFDPELNLVDYLLAPSLVSAEIALKAKSIAEKTVKAFDSAGLYAVELFLDNNDTLFVNEIAPRAHNSGHATIEAATISQYDMQLRIFQSLPIVEPHYHHATIMWNLIGAEGYVGKVKYENMKEAMNIEGIYLHLYGKENTKPGRKMGHITILENDIEMLKEKLTTVKNHVRVISEKMNS